MSKKKILVVNHQMQLGGVCIAAKNFIENMHEDYDIEYMLANRAGELDNRLPKQVKVSYMPFPLDVVNIRRKECNKKGFRYGIKKFISLALTILVSGPSAARYLCKGIKRHKKECDIVINNDMDMNSKYPGACHAYTKYCVKAKTKCLIIHGDFLANNYDQKFFKKEYLPVYDYVILLSEAARKQMIDLYPEYTEKFIVITNFEADDEIKEMSKEREVELPKGILNIVSASRLTGVKAIPRSLSVFKRLKDEGYKFCWHILGEGEQRAEIETFIKENEMQDFVVLHGLQNNPYPFMRSADMLYLGSYHESYGLVLIESMIVGKPVLTTNTVSAKEVVPNEYGWICENNEEDIYNSFKYILDNPNELIKKTDNLKDYKFDNKSIKEKYDNLIGN